MTTNSTSDEREQRLKQIRAKRLRKIKEAVDVLENSIVEPRKDGTAMSSRAGVFSRLYYLERLARRAK